MCAKKYLALLSGSPIQKEHKETHFDEWWKGAAIHCTYRITFSQGVKRASFNVQQDTGSQELQSFFK